MEIEVFRLLLVMALTIRLYTRMTPTHWSLAMIPMVKISCHTGMPMSIGARTVFLVLLLICSGVPVTVGVSSQQGKSEPSAVYGPVIVLENTVHFEE